MGRAPMPMTPVSGTKRYQSSIETGNERAMWWASPMFFLILAVVGYAAYLAFHG